VTEPIVVVAWLIVAHLVADFVIQTHRIATEKQGEGRAAGRALLDHAVGVGACLLPVVLAFGLPAVVLLIVVAVSHVAIDRTKVVLNRRAEASALDAALDRYGTLAGSGGLGTAWTPVPAALFVVDQLVHVIVLVLGWYVLLRDAPLTQAWTDLVSAPSAGLAPADVRTVGLASAVAIALLIVNVRAASLLIATLVSPREVTLGEPPVEPHESAPTEPVPAATAAANPSGSAPRATSSAIAWERPSSAVPSEPRQPAAQSAAAAGPPRSSPSPSGPSPSGPARIGEAIGVLERLLVVAFVLTGSLAAIGFVVAAKTLARFKQLDDRAFAEYYLLGTLASVSIALASALLAAAALGVAP